MTEPSNEQQWRVAKDNGSSVVRTAAGIRDQLARGKLNGTELVRAPGESEWVPLHATALFAEAVPHVGDPQKAANWRVARSILFHAAAYVVVVLAVGRGGFPSWAFFWGIGLVLHAVQSAVALARNRSTARPPAVAADPEPVGFLADVDDAVLSVRATWTVAALGPEPDLDGLRAAAASLERRRAALSQLCPPGAKDQLREELGNARQRVDQSEGASKVVYTDELRAHAEVDAALGEARRRRTEVLVGGG